jgi:L-rhamnose mutarotase
MNVAMKTVLAGTLIAALSCFLTHVVVSGEKPARQPTRYGSVIGLRKDKIDEYKKLHAAIWPEVAKATRDANIRNYSIYLRKLEDGNYRLFSYFEYVGSDFKADMAAMAANADVKRWWKVTDACQTPLADRKRGEWWASAEEVFHQD